MKFASLQVLLLLCLGLLSGCDKFEYHPYDAHISGSQGLTARNIEQIQSQCAGKDTLRVAQISDTQRWYDETQALVDAINARGDVDFVIHCGDQSDFGLTKEFEWQRDIMAGFKTIVGGELKGYTEMMADARRIATERMVKEAENLGADAIRGIRYTSSDISQAAAEMLVYGTAVKLK